jgi:hypothetical protein
MFKSKTMETYKFEVEFTVADKLSNEERADVQQNLGLSMLSIVPVGQSVISVYIMPITE